jgi:hypothetical protein
VPAYVARHGNFDPLRPSPPVTPHRSPRKLVLAKADQRTEQTIQLVNEPENLCLALQSMRPLRPAGARQNHFGMAEWRGRQLWQAKAFIGRLRNSTGGSVIRLI